MNAHAVLEMGAVLVLVLLLALPLGAYVARVYTWRTRRHERAIYRLARIDAAHEMRWHEYLQALLVFNLGGAIAVYAILRMQALLPFNPLHLPAVPAGVAFNTAVSFVTNTNWQAYSGETTMSFFSQMVALTTQNFLSAATGMAVLMAMVRGFTRANSETVGNFWVDLVRGTLYVLLPLALLLAIVLVALGVVQTFTAVVTAGTQTLAMGPVASQVAIKQLGTNGGGFFNVNSAHPFENPTPLSNLFELAAILLVPASLCFSFGALVRDRRQGLALLGAMLLVLVPCMALTIVAEQGNMEGKELRFGVVGSALWAVASTAASNGSVNAMLDSFTPLGGLVPMLLIQLGEIILGGVGSGLYGMLVYAIIAVFLCGLMVGRTPEYLGKKIEAHEMKMASLVILVPALTILLGAAIACVIPAGVQPLGNTGPHGFSEILYAFSSAAGNNGSAFAGLGTDGDFYTIAIAVAMLLGRYGVIVPVLAITGSLARKKVVPANAGTLPTHTPLFVTLLTGTILLVGALTFVPALALGPIVEHLLLGLK